MENEDNNENRHASDTLETTTNLNSQATVHPFTRENLVGFKGRMNRLDFAILIIALGVVKLLVFKSSGINPMLISLKNYLEPESLTESTRLFGQIMLIGTFLYAYISVKRLHDIGYSGYLALIFITPILPLGVIKILLGCVILVLQLILIFAPGTPEKNEFGSRPVNNHRNKVLLLITAIFLWFMLSNSLATDALPELQPLIEEIMEQAGA